KSYGRNSPKPALSVFNTLGKDAENSSCFVNRRIEQLKAHLMTREVNKYSITQRNGTAVA
ncbi:MAG: hypothetical protein ACRCTP_12195, partial [Aeromonas popoffii]|uniref:hypothetical protein n=1 Tax=Aeromonas popoffii TaxID=70856 RepID=UPI003F3FCCDC